MLNTLMQRDPATRFEIDTTGWSTPRIPLLTPR